MYETLEIERRGKVDMQRVVHHVAEIAARREVRESRHDALTQFVRWQAAAHGQPQIRADFRDGVEHRRGDRQVPEAVAGDVGKEVQVSDS